MKDKFTLYCLIFIIVGCGVLAIMDAVTVDTQSFMFGFTSGLMSGSTIRNTGVTK